MRRPSRITLPLLGGPALVALLLTGCSGIVVPSLDIDDDGSVVPGRPSRDVSAHYERCEGLETEPEGPFAPRPADYLELVPAAPDEVDAAVTRFGGQPSWIDEPQWPISAQLGEPMSFIGQVALRDELVPGSDGHMAYIFMSGGVTDFVEWTWDPEVGENAVIVQPGGTPVVPVEPIATSPDAFGPEVLSARAETLVDAAYILEADRANWSQRDWADYGDPLLGFKVGGTPAFLQSAEFPECGELSQLLVQLAWAPRDENFGDGGEGFAFIADDLSYGRFLWQSH